MSQPDLVQVFSEPDTDNPDSPDSNCSFSIEVPELQNAELNDISASRVRSRKCSNFNPNTYHTLANGVTNDGENAMPESEVDEMPVNENRRCHEKTSYVSNYAFFTLLHKWGDRGQTHRLEKLQQYTSTNEIGITRIGVFLIDAYALYRPIHTIK